MQVEATRAKNFASVAAGEFFSLALTHDRGTLYSFGRCDYGQLGTGVSNAKENPYFATPQVVKFPKRVMIASIEAGDRHAMVLTTDRELYTWGFNEYGTTGHPRNEKNVSDQLSDVYRPTLLVLDVQPECIPVQCSGGGQHSLILVQSMGLAHDSN